MKRIILPLLVALLSLVSVGSAQDTKPLYFRIRDIHVGLEVNAERETTEFNGSGQTTYDRLFIGPVFGLNCVGWSYHPNLLQFKISGEISPGYITERQTGDYPFNRNESAILGNYDAHLFLLWQKPYRSDIFLQQTYNLHDYDYFNSVEVDTLSYGIHTGYNRGPVPVSINMWRRSEDTHGSVNDSTTTETELTLDATHTRTRGKTVFNYTFDDYQRTDEGATGGGPEHTFSLGDSETLGSRDQSLLNLGTRYTNRDYTDSPGNEFEAFGDLAVNHTRTLSSFYNINYNHTTDDTSIGTTKADNTFAEASLRHQLFKSLTSTARIYGAINSVEGDFNRDASVQSTTSDITRYGGGIAENYSKRLGQIGQLSLYTSVMMDRVSVDNGGDTIIRTDEAHSFSANQAGDAEDSFFLNQPYVDQGSIVITDDKNRTPAFVQGRDYTVSENGSLTMIRRTPNSTIPVNSTVLVDYRAKSPGTGDYNSVTSVANARIDLWKGKLSLYGHWNSVQNNASEGLEVQDLQSYAVGMETRWKWLRAGAEYSVYDSNFSDYSSVRLFESLNFPLDDRSSWTLDFVQSFADYGSSNRTENSYWFLTRYHRNMGRNWWVNLDSGLLIRRGEGSDETEARIHPSLELRIGRLTAKLNYTYEYRDYLDSSKRQRHLLFLSAERKF